MRFSTSLRSFRREALAPVTGSRLSKRLCCKWNETAGCSGNRRGNRQRWFSVIHECWLGLHVWVHHPKGCGFESRAGNRKSHRSRRGDPKCRCIATESREIKVCGECLWNYSTRNAQVAGSNPAGTGISDRSSVVEQERFIICLCRRSIVHER